MQLFIIILLMKMFYRQYTIVLGRVKKCYQTQYCNIHPKQYDGIHVAYGKKFYCNNTENYTD